MIGFGENNEDILIRLLNKCPNIERLQFSDISSESFFKVLENIKCPKVKTIYATCEDLDRDYDWSKVFENLPFLEKLDIEEHHTMCWTYDVSPVFLAEKQKIIVSTIRTINQKLFKWKPRKRYHITI